MTVAQARQLQPGAAVQVTAVMDDEITEVRDAVRGYLGQRGRVLEAMDHMYLIDVALEQGERYQFSPEEIEHAS